MPFYTPFRTRFYKNDLIFGMNQIRAAYSDNNLNFITARHHNDEGLYPPVVIDRYLTPAERRNIQETREVFNERMKKNDWENPEEKSEYEKSLESFNYFSEYANKNNLEYMRYENDYFQYLRKDHKYSSVVDINSDYNKLNIGRKCKGGLKWVSMSNSGLTKNMHIHFLLDKINLNLVVNKTNKSITGKELRWLFRNKDNSDVAAKVQFWNNNTPVRPPWETEPDIWLEYSNRDEYSEVFSRLFNLP